MDVASPLVWLFAASLINAVPSNEAFHPERARCDLAEGDLSGSGREIAGSVTRAMSRDASAAGRSWHVMAQRCRSLADWHTGHAREVLLRMAAEYEQRAQRTEAPAAPDDTSARDADT